MSQSLPLEQGPFGTTRTRVRSDYALLTPDGHVPAPLQNWTNTDGVIVISPALGAEFCQYLVHGRAGSSSAGAALGVERFVWVAEGSVTVRAEGREEVLDDGGYFFAPADVGHSLECSVGCRLWVFEKPFEALEGEGASGADAPSVVFGNSADVEAIPFLGDPDARLKTLLPDLPGYDLAVNLFTYEPGATLPFVETHIMEHGLLMVDGMGVYRLGDDWHPVQKGDVIWMAPYCPQWFVAMGKTQASYLYYKNVNRDPLA